MILAPKALEILIVLVEQAGELASKEMLIERVWPGTFVEENNLSQQISALRKELASHPGSFTEADLHAAPDDDIPGGEAAPAKPEGGAPPPPKS